MFATDFLKRPSHEFIEVRGNLKLPGIVAISSLIR
jgi:hypothetical protein